mmetsp:Transcript_4232/g.15203  ORF Transcript_4232/g.15203 Transcript_4232/m.15203 type:complete len:155 (-) Transcript_4232:535-999(-)
MVASACARSCVVPSLTRQYDRTATGSRVTPHYTKGLRSCRLSASPRMRPIAQRAGQSGRLTAHASLEGGNDLNQQVIEGMVEKIKTGLETDRVSVEDVKGDGQRVIIEVVAEAFEGLNAMKRQRLVYNCIWDELETNVHAVEEMSTKTPAEAEA